VKTLGIVCAEEKVSNELLVFVFMSNVPMFAKVAVVTGGAVGIPEDLLFIVETSSFGRKGPLYGGIDKPAERSASAWLPLETRSILTLSIGTRDNFVQGGRVKWLRKIIVTG
jgi:hypothetical protein